MENSLEKDSFRVISHSVPALPHGVLDYAMSSVCIVAPSVFGFQKKSTVAAQAVGSMLLGTSLMTKYPLGVVKRVPFPVHGGLEFCAALGMIAAPWLLGFSKRKKERNFFVANGVALLGLWSLTDYTGEFHKVEKPAKKREVKLGVLDAQTSPEDYWIDHRRVEEPNVDLRM